MKKPSFDRRIIQARPEGFSSDARFTDRVMNAIEETEILSSAIRKMSVTKKERLIMKFKRLPIVATIALALGATLLLSGGVYAAYQLLWPKPQVQVSEPSTSASGREEVEISLAQCGGADIGSRYELKKGATISAEDIPHVVQAQCELGVIRSWADATFEHDNRRGAGSISSQPYDSSQLSVSMATHIKSSNDSAITFTGLTKYNQTDKTYELNDKVRYFADGREVTRSDISPQDPVVYVSLYKERMTPQPGCNELHCSISGTLLSDTLLAVVKLSQPFEYYDQFAWQSLTEKMTCMGNANETCLTGYIGGIDLYQGDSASLVNEHVQAKEIQGVISRIDGTTITLRASSGTLYTIHAPSDVISSYNANRAQMYNGQTVKVGSSLMILYAEPAAEHDTSIAAASLLSIQLQTEAVGKSDAPVSY